MRSGWERLDGTTKDVGNSSVCVEDGWTEGERIVRKGSSMLLMVQQVKHVLGSLSEIIVSREFGKGNFFGEEIDLEYVSFMHRVLEVALPTTVMFKGGTDLPANLAVFAKGGASVGGGVCYDLSAHGGKWCTIEIVVSEKRSMS